MLDKTSKRVIKDCNRISIDTQNKCAQAIEEVIRVENSREECKEILESLIRGIEYKLDEIKEWAKSY